jgi:hypothetical protein
MDGLDWRFSASRAVVKYAYDRRARQLYVVFTGGGGLYRYLGIPPGEVAKMEGAESLGTFVNHEIKPNYDGERRETDGRFTPVPRVGRPREAARRERARKAPPASPKRKPSAQREPRPAIGPRA